MNRDNIKKVRDVIAALPEERFDMTDYFSNEVAATAPGAVKGCGTAACIAGWTLSTLTPRARTENVDGKAAKLLGLASPASGQLFRPQGYWDAGTYPVDHAVRVLDHLLETGEVDWVSTRRAKKAVAS